MMKNLLEHNFILHYGLTASATVNVDTTNDVNFELRDVTSSGVGIARYQNPERKTVNNINYETFFKSLPQSFQNGKENCDFIVYTADVSHFLLNELTDTNAKYVSDFKQRNGNLRTGKRNKAISQLTQTLQNISDIPAIETFIKQYTVRHCCFFNTQPHAPVRIETIDAFNRLSSIVSGFKISAPNIEALGFEMRELSGNQSYKL
jgi:hypothetical protein